MEPGMKRNIRTSLGVKVKVKIIAVVLLVTMMMMYY